MYGCRRNVRGWISKRLKELVSCPVGRVWQQELSPERIHILTMNDMLQKPAQAMRAVERFLGLPEHGWEGHFTTLPNGHTTLVGSKSKAERGYKAGIAPMSNVTRELLSQFYAPFDAELARLLGRSSMGWL